VGDEVRAHLFDSDFFANFTMVTLPALLLFGAIFFAARTPSSAGDQR
jgi:hypothetical protein